MQFLRPELAESSPSLPAEVAGQVPITHVDEVSTWGI